MVACIDFFEMSEICRPKFIVRHSTRLVILMLTDLQENALPHLVQSWNRDIMCILLK
jgi:hypothetical protein